MQITRRAALAGAGAAALATPAHATVLSPELAAMPGYRGWDSPRTGGRAPMDTFVETGTGPKRLSSWLEGRPTVLALWATWCGPCLIEKGNQARMAQRLAAANARARIVVLQAFDQVPLNDARRTLARLGAASLINARATEDAEDAFVRIFGASPRDPQRTSMPALMLLGADGSELGRAIGTMVGADGETDYWEDEATFSFLSRL